MYPKAMKRRKPVPRQWREDNHFLSTHSHAWGHGFRRASRTKGYCSCGVRWPESKYVDNLTYADVREEWLDHVAKEYHGEESWYAETPAE